MEKLMLKKSDELMHYFFKNLDSDHKHNIGLMGGWAVHYLLKSKDVVHMGSRDIDVFFNPAKLKPATLEKRLEKLGFHRHSTFRWAQYFDSDSERELSLEESKKHPLYDTSTIYFDIAVPGKVEHTMPEPLLKRVFAGEKELINIRGVEVMVPSTRILTEMKLKSAPQRSDVFKRTKDIADIYGLLDSDNSLWIEKNGQRIKTTRLNKKSIETFRQKIPKFKIDRTLTASANMLNIDEKKLTELLEKI